MATSIFDDSRGLKEHAKFELPSKTIIIPFLFQVYYDTPYDRHVILEESHDVRYRKRNSKGLEDPPGLGSRILRYASFL